MSHALIAIILTENFETPPGHHHVGVVPIEPEVALVHTAERRVALSGQNGHVVSLPGYGLVTAYRCGAGTQIVVARQSHVGLRFVVCGEFAEQYALTGIIAKNQHHRDETKAFPQVNIGFSEPPGRHLTLHHDFAAQHPGASYDLLLLIQRIGSGHVGLIDPRIVNAP